MKFLQELKEFHVKEESVGFELGELGKLDELGGELNICGLENVRTKQEAKEAKLMAKRNLVELGLVWNREQEFTGDDILDSLQPHSNIRRLHIVNHSGAIGPSWLCSSNVLCMKNLETLHLENVSWANLPPIGQMYRLRKLKLKNIVGISHIGPDFFGGGTTEKGFTHLKKVEFHDMPELVEWVGEDNCHLLSGIEKIVCIGCPRLTTLLFSGWPNNIWFPSLHHLCIRTCPKLCLPPLPHTLMVSDIKTEWLGYDRTSLTISKPCELAFQNLGDLRWLSIYDEATLSLMDLQKLHSLRHIEINRCEETFLRGLDDGVVLHKVEILKLRQFPLTRKSLSNLFKSFTALSSLDVWASSDEDHEEVVLQFPPSSSLRIVGFRGCENLILPVKEEEGTGFWGLSSIESVAIRKCDKLFSRWSMGGAAAQTQSIIYPLPPCLKNLMLGEQQSTLPMALLTNLTSLTVLRLLSCKDITVDGFDPRIICNLERLVVYNERDGEAEPYSVADLLLAAVARTKTMSAGSFQQLAYLCVDNISEVLVSPICTCLSATLQGLLFYYDWRTEKFTEEQDEALQLLTSLQDLMFINCSALQSLPQGLYRLPSLKELGILGKHKIRSLPKEGLPDSLRKLSIQRCGPEIYEECKKLSGTRPDINTSACKP
jgi:hypothetical protein